MATNRIGLFGGTFNPVHTGHVSLVKSFLGSGKIDELWIIPSPSPPHKTDKNIISFEHRKKMLELALSGIDNVKISDVEERLPLPSYTIQTVQYLKQKFPDDIFFLCMGEDSLAEFNSWYKPDKIAKECRLLVAERPGREHTGENRFVQEAQFIEHEPVDVSSTELRSVLNNGKTQINEKVPKAVLEYIEQNNLYQD